jgi:hypothetical protein
MRLKVLVPLVMLSGLVLLALLCFKQPPSLSGGGTADPSRDPGPAPDAVRSGPAYELTHVPGREPGSVTAVGPASGALTNHESYIARRVAELQDLAMENDSASLNIILSELTNRDREIRSAAIDASVQFGSREAIPALSEAAPQIEDADQKAAIHEAIDYLQLPALSEIQLPSRGRGLRR